VKANGWPVKTLGDALVRTETVNPQERPNSEFEYVDVSSVSNESFEVTDTQRLKGKDAPSRARRMIRANDVLFATIRPTLRRIAVVPERLDGQVCSTGYFVMRPKPDLDSRFLFYSLFTNTFMDQMEALQTGASYPAVNDSQVRAQLVPVPPLPEQRRIVGILDEAFAGIATAKANAEKNLRNARELFESHLHSEHEERALLGELVDIKTGKLDANAAVEGGEYPFFTCSREIFAIDKYAFDCEAILLAGNNAVGDFNVKHYKGKFNAYQRTYVITVNASKRVLYRFLYFQMLKSLKQFKSQSVGTGTKFLKMGMITGLEIALPSVEEQKRIVDTMDAVRVEAERLASLYQQKLSALDGLKKSLLHQAFSGGLGEGLSVAEAVNGRGVGG
jgi:type I restriction enzyme S subunit